MIHFSLFLVRLFKKPFQWVGVDYPQFETLLRNSLIMDFRRNPASQKVSKKRKNPFRTRLFVFTMLGGFIEFTVYPINDILLNLTILYSIIMVMLAMTVINEFTSVLFDERENDILLPRPVSHRTLLWARIMRVQFYVGYIALALSVFSGIVLAFKYNVWVMVAFFVGVGLSVWITLLFTIFFYLALSKVVKGNKFKDFITYVQIFLSVVIFGGYQLLPQMVDKTDMNRLHMSVHGWTYLIPPAWVAGFVKFLTFPHGVPVTLFFVLALAVPFLGVFIVTRFLSQGFGDILASDTVSEKSGTGKVSFKGKLSYLSGRLFCVTESERLGWELTLKMTRRDRKFKQAAYPMLAVIPVMAVLMLKPDFSHLADSFQKIGLSHRYLFFIFLGFFGIMSIFQLPYTDTPEASWIYRATPFNRHGHILSGAVKALLYKLLFPIYLFLTICALAIWKVQIFPQMLLGGLLLVLLTLIMVILYKMNLPFTQPREVQQKGNLIFLTFLGMFLMGVPVVVVYLSTFLPGWGVWAVNGLVIGLIALVNRSIRSKAYRLP
jgi:ABC-2 type transport system permease protein